MLFDNDSLLNFSYTKHDKDLLINLLSVKGVGRRTAIDVLYHLKKHENRVGNVLGIISKIKNKKNAINSLKNLNLDQINYSLKQRFEKDKIKVISFWEKDYPKPLKMAYDFPLLLFVKGNLNLLNSKSIAVVGTRKVTAYGQMATKKLVNDLTDYGYTIVSGCMYGVDEVAHLAAIENKGGTVAVLGYGFDCVTPTTVVKTQNEILKSGGCLVTEYFPDVKATKGTFPQRNRIVAGMCSGVLVVEAATKSGTLITVDFALELGRDIFAVPGSINNPYAEGTKHLINQGAILVTSGKDIVAELDKFSRISDSCGKNTNNFDFDKEINNLGLDDLSRKIIKELAFLPQSTNDLVKKTNLSIRELLTVLGMLELENMVKNDNGVWHCVILLRSLEK